MNRRSTKSKAHPIQRTRGRSSNQLDLPTHGAGRAPVVRAFFDDDDVVVDHFAGGGGASYALEMALGRSPDIAVNHDAEAIAMHAANHPTTRHYTESVWKVDPKKACGKRRVGVMWLSPDCKGFSKAKGGKPRNQKIRGLAWIAVTWAQRVKPKILFLENVQEFTDWGPLYRDHSDRCVRSHCTVARGKTCKVCLGAGCCKKTCHFDKPIKERKGETFKAFVRKLKRLGYVVEWKLLRAHEYGAATKRRRLFLVARRDGQPIAWPEPTHGKREALVQPRTTAEIVDWSIPCPSIFDRKKDLADKTLARIARGIRKFVLEAAKPFVIPVNHGKHYRPDGTARAPDLRVHSIDDPMPTITGSCRGGHALVSPMVVKAKTYGGGGNDAKSADEPIGTITASKRGEFALAVPYLVHRSNGERPGQEPRIYDPQEPLGTIVAQGNKHAACVALLEKHGNVAFLAKHYGGNESSSGGTDLGVPMDTITSRDHHSLVAAHVIKFQGTSEAHLDASASGMDEPAPTITAQGMKLAQVAAFLVRYNGTGDAESVEEPVGALTTKPRFGLVTVMIDGEEYVIVDIGMRMLTASELFAAQGFPPGYQISPMVERVMKNGKTKRAKLTSTAQIRMCGNSVSPPPAIALIRANLPLRAAA